MKIFKLCVLVFLCGCLPTSILTEQQDTFSFWNRSGQNINKIVINRTASQSETGNKDWNIVLKPGDRESISLNHTAPYKSDVYSLNNIVIYDDKGSNKTTAWDANKSRMQGSMNFEIAPDLSVRFITAARRIVNKSGIPINATIETSPPLGALNNIQPNQSPIPFWSQDNIAAINVCDTNGKNCKRTPPQGSLSPDPFKTGSNMIIINPDKSVSFDFDYSITA